MEERGVDKKTGKTVVEVDPRYFRPNEVDILLGDSSKARKILGWKPKVTFKKLAALMAKEDFEYAQREAILHTPIANQRRIIGYGQTNGKNTSQRKTRRAKN
jgi:GDPmannose 4,6-dehydratase